MIARKIDAYILRETLLPFCVGTLVFSFILLSGRALNLADLMIARGVSATQIGALLLYLLPSFLMFTVPLAFLLAALMAIGRLSADSELIALKAAGIGLPSIARPIILLAVVVSLGTAYITFVALPDSYGRFRDLLFQTAKINATLGLQAGHFNTNFDGLTIYTERLDDQRGLLTHVFISDTRKADAPATITATQGQLVSEPDQRRLLLRLQNGFLQRPKDTGEIQSIRFSQYDISLDLDAAPDATLNRRTRDKELGLAQLRQRFNGPHDLGARIEFHRRFALPVSSLVFALLAIPLGLVNQRAGKGAGISTALLTFLAYYLTYSLGKTLAENGVLWPGPAMWLANILLCVVGLYLFRRALQERPPIPEPLRDWRQRLRQRRSP